jgi:CheY-like chemotaxis protein
MGSTLTEPMSQGTGMVPTTPEILVVDDDSTVRQMLGALLNLQGFQVHLASSGKAAVDVLLRHRATIRGALLDIHMPDLSGPDTLAALLAINPDLPCCFMTGHTGSYPREDLLKMGAREVFRKPFLKPLELVDALRVAFDLEEKA